MCVFLPVYIVLCRQRSQNRPALCSRNSTHFEKLIMNWDTLEGLICKGGASLIRLLNKSDNKVTL
jgi:hypothetical protein